MRLSTRSTYGIRALVELALAGRGPVSASWIARRQELSVAYLEQLLHRLKREGFVTSVRGPRGGYRLAKPPQAITMDHVVITLDGANGGDAGLGAKGRRPRSSRGRSGRTRGGLVADGRRHAQHVERAVWRCVHDRLMESLGAVTLQDLCAEVQAESGEPLEHRYVFHI